MRTVSRSAAFVCLAGLWWVGACWSEGRPSEEGSEPVAVGRPLPVSVVTGLLERHGVPGVSIAVVHDGRIDWAEGYGVRERGRPERVDTTTLFQAASISKPVAAAVAPRMVASDRFRSLHGSSCSTLRE